MIYVVSGENSYQTSKYIDDLVSKFVSENSMLAVEKLDGQDVTLEQLVAAVSSVPFLSSKKMIIVKSLGLQKDLAENIDQILSQVSDVTELVIYEPKIDKRGSYYKKLKKLEGFKEFSQIAEQELAKWLIQTAKEQNAKLSLSDANYLIERAGVDQQKLANELDKLIRYNPQITRESITLLVAATPQSSIFELIDSAFNNDPKKTLELYEQQRAQGIEPLNILGMFAWQLHAVSLVQAAKDKSISELSVESGIKPFVLQKSQRISRSLGSARLNKLIEDLLTLDKAFKTTTLDQDTALKSLLAGLRA